MNKDAPPVQPHNTTVCANLPAGLGYAVALLTLVAVAGCSKQAGLPTRELFQRIQVYETRIAGGELAVRSATSCREAFAPSESEVCDPSVALCELTAGVENKDAVRRCLIASDSCRAARERARALCATPAPQ